MSSEILKHCMIIAEVAQAHDGSLGMAHAFIDAIAAAGADAVKFQTHLAAAESSPSEPWRVKFSYQDATRYDYWKRMEFTEPQWAGLKEHATEKGLKFLSSPFSIEAVELLGRIGVSAWKIASGEFNNLPMLDRILEYRLIVELAGRDFPGGHADAAEQFHGLDGKRRAQKFQALFGGVFLEAGPLRLGEFHALPVVVAGGVLVAELDAPGLGGGAFGGGEVGLELDRVGAGGRDGIDEGVGHAEAAIVRLRHLGDDHAMFEDFRRHRRRSSPCGGNNRRLPAAA